jgi:phosphogluconate dehydratase
VLIDAAEWAARTPAPRPDELADDHAYGLGRELFSAARRSVRSAEEGAVSWL